MHQSLNFDVCDYNIDVALALSAIDQLDLVTA